MPSIPGEAILPLTADHIGKQGGSYEPQRSNNGRLLIADLPSVGKDDVLALSLQGFSVPKIASNVLTIGYLNETRKFAGNPMYEGITVTFHDYVDIDTATILWAWRRLVHNPLNGTTGLARDYKKTGTIELFAPNGTFVRAYKLQGLWPVSLDPGDINMTSDEPILINCALEVDKWFPEFAGITENEIPSSATTRV
jgi:hypothetical protein